MSSMFSDILAICDADGDLTEILNDPADLFQFNLANQNASQNEYAENECGVVKKEEDVPEVAEEPVGNYLRQPFIISNEEYPGPYQFNVFIDPHHGSKSPWVFSVSLNKVFILMNHSFPIDFKWSNCSVGPLFVRATPVFASEHQHEVVTRCIPHAQAEDKSNIGYDSHIWDHIVRCRNPNAAYVGSKREQTHLSVIVPLGAPQTGADTVRHMYEFVCKNSCATGMNRRQLEVIFTLEDVDGQVLGRKTLNVRVCSCPKRDKDKEEREFSGSRAVRNGAPPQIRKRKREEKKPPSFTESSVDTKEYEVNLKIIGKRNANAVLKFAHDLMAGEMVRHNTEHLYRRCMLDIGQTLNGSSNLSD